MRTTRTRRETLSVDASCSTEGRLRLTAEKAEAERVADLQSKGGEQNAEH